MAEAMGSAFGAILLIVLIVALVVLVAAKAVSATIRAKADWRQAGESRAKHTRGRVSAEVADKEIQQEVEAWMARPRDDNADLSPASILVGALLILAVAVVFVVIAS